MKIRQGFVSNSSSSSFILVANEPLTEEFFRREYAWLGVWAEPIIHFLTWKGDDEIGNQWDYEHPMSFGGPHDDRTPTQRWKEENGVAPDAYMKEYRISNWNDDECESGDVAQAFYYKGYSHLETKNIKTFYGTVSG